MIKKFRVWSKSKNRFLSGILITEDGLVCHIEKYEEFSLPKNQDDFTIQQWTGLTDSQGVEIYEGDILKWGEKNLSKVEFYNGAFFVFGINWGACWQLADYADAYNIVGNIFQNPELLEKS